MKEYTIKKPLKPTKVSISLPASKSISNRLLVMNFLSGNKVHIENLSNAEDTLLMKTLLHKINHSLSQKLTNDLCELDCRNAGTVFRFLTALLACQPGIWLLTGSERMKERPVKTLCSALTELGAVIDYTEHEGYPPLRITGSVLKGGTIKVDGSQSSQYVSALAMIAPKLDEGLEIFLQNEVASKPYIDMTLSLMAKAGAKVHESKGSIFIEQKAYRHSDIRVEADWSSASYWYEIAAVKYGSEILLENLSLSSIQGDSVLSDLYSRLGVGSFETGKGVLIKKVSEPEPNINYDFRDCPDLVPAVAATCAALNLDAKLSGLINLRIKESNRLEALTTELSKINKSIFIDDDSLVIKRQENPVFPHNVVFQSYGDHRMAMALAPLAYCCAGVSIENPQVVSKSYPSFWDDFQKAGFRVK